MYHMSREISWYTSATSQYPHAPNITFRSRSPHNALHSPSNNWGERERAHPCRSKARFFHIRSRVIPQSSFYASFLISTHAQQRPVHTAGSSAAVEEGEEPVEATCRKATT